MTQGIDALSRQGIALPTRVRSREWVIGETIGLREVLQCPTESLMTLILPLKTSSGGATYLEYPGSARLGTIPRLMLRPSRKRFGTCRGYTHSQPRPHQLWLRFPGGMTIFPAGLGVSSDSDTDSVSRPAIPIQEKTDVFLRIVFLSNSGMDITGGFSGYLVDNSLLQT